MVAFLKKIFLAITITTSCFLIVVFMLFTVLKFHSKNDFNESKKQYDKILQLVYGCKSVKDVTFFCRSRENDFKYNMRLLFTDGVELFVGDVYLRNDILHYGSLFWIGDYTEPYMLYYDGKKIALEPGMFKNITDSDVIEIYQKHNLSLFLEKKDCILDFLKNFSLIEKETYEKIYDYNYKEELINKFNLQNIYFISEDGALNWIDDNVKWVVLNADLIYSRKKE